jgi:hypothetical protein
MPLCPLQIPYGLAGAWTRVSAVRRRHLTAWAVARPEETLTSTKRHPITWFSSAHDINLWDLQAIARSARHWFSFTTWRATAQPAATRLHTRILEHLTSSRVLRQLYSTVSMHENVVTLRMQWATHILACFPFLRIEDRLMRLPCCMCALMSVCGPLSTFEPIVRFLRNYVWTLCYWKPPKTSCFHCNIIGLVITIWRTQTCEVGATLVPLNIGPLN